MNSRKIVCTVLSVKWVHDEANVGDSVGVEAEVRFRAVRNRSDPEAMVEETFKIDFEISEYSGIPPHRGGGFRRVEVETISEEVKVALKSGTEVVKSVKASWVVLACEETSPDGGLPEFCVRALYNEVGPQSKMMKIGDIVDLCWIRKGKEATALNQKKAKFWFENNQKVILRAESHLLNGF
jgi:hypothetical protein